MEGLRQFKFPSFPSLATILFCFNLWSKVLKYFYWIDGRMEARYLFEWLRNGLDVNFSSKSWRDLVKTLIVKILRICQYIIWSGFITDLVNNSQVLRRISFLNQWTNFQFCSQLGKTKNPFLDAKAPLVQNAQLLFLRYYRPTE